MNGYSRIRGGSSPRCKPRSTESSGRTSPFASRLHGDPKTPSKAQRGGFEGFKIPWQEEEGEEERERERGGVVLSRTCSSASQRFRASERGQGGLQAVVRRTFSMRKPSSVAEGYWRIHGDGDGGDGDEGMGSGEQQHQQQQEEVVKRKRGRIFRACKRLFRF